MEFLSEQPIEKAGHCPAFFWALFTTAAFTQQAQGRACKVAIETDRAPATIAALPVPCPTALDWLSDPIATLAVPAPVSG